MTQIFKTIFSFSILCMFILVLGCGRKSLPKPPERTAPAAIELYQAVGRLEGIELKWRAPTKDASGGDLTDLAGFLVEKSIYEKSKSPSFEEIAYIKYVAVQEDSNEKVNEFSYFDKEEIIPGKQYEYRVRAVNTDGVKGIPAYILRITFLGETSTVERINIKQKKIEE